MHTGKGAMFTHVLKSSHDHTIVEHAGLEIAAIYGLLGAGASLAPLGGAQLVEFPTKGQLIKTQSFCVYTCLNIGQQIQGFATPEP